MRLIRLLFAPVLLLAVLVLRPGPTMAQDAPQAEWRKTLAAMQAQLERLSEQVKTQGALLEEQRGEIARLRAALAPAAGPGEDRAATGAAPVLGARRSGSGETTTSLAGTAPSRESQTTRLPSVAALAAAEPNTPEPPKPPAATGRPETPAAADLARNLNGFRFSGDFRYRFDVQARPATAVAGPLQNVRSRYRLRLNVDKQLAPGLRAHVQLSTGPLSNGITNDQDMAGTIAKHFFTLAEAYMDYHPAEWFSIRGGRMEEVFADGMRFLWDDDVRFNGFHQVLRLPLGKSALAFDTFELRSGEYWLSNPNVPVLPANSPYVQAGYRPGQKIRDANLFHPGVVLSGKRGAWAQQLTADIQLYRNPDQIQLASTTAGVAAVVNPALGVALAGPMSGTGNATTTPGGAQYAAGHFQIGRLAYRLGYNQWKAGSHPMPVWVDAQLARNFGAGQLRDAVMLSGNLGDVKQRGDTRFLYQFAIKDANSLISQFTDDDLATGTGVNVAVHALRFDIGLSRFLQFQNLLFIQNARRPSNPADHLFVPVPRGVGTTYRYLSQLAFTF